MSDRKLGYVVILFLILFALVPAVYLTTQMVEHGFQRTVLFDSVNTGSFLRIQDPVRIKGVTIGMVSGVDYKNKKTVLTIETDGPLQIYQGYRIVADAKGFMGDRYVEIQPGDPTTGEIDPKTPLIGLFPLGPTEALALTGQLVRLADSLVVLTKALKNGTAEQPPFEVRFRKVTLGLDSVLVSLIGAMKQLEKFADTRGDSLIKSLQSANDYSTKLSASLPKTLNAASAFIGTTQSVLTRADSLVASTDKLLARIHGKETDTLYQKLSTLKKRVAALKDAIAELERHGLDFTVKLR